MWFYAFAAALLMVPVLPLFQSAVLRIVTVLAGMLAFLGVGILFRLPERRGAEKAAGSLIALADVSLALVMVLLVADAMLASGSERYS